ncbi:hypothetical protein MLD38_032238 [Melastoma candidum]|uniref:Uncharacterized protein n=1 Tax=Melastoma candidum TaxID=119954 RepID=A0ACB9M3H2_9MYRT|nr:hypothetical protein MLD38_032238 [Melastoma candidum]
MRKEDECRDPDSPGKNGPRSSSESCRIKGTAPTKILLLFQGNLLLMNIHPGLCGASGFLDMGWSPPGGPLSWNTRCFRE